MRHIARTICPVWVPLTWLAFAATGAERTPETTSQTAPGRPNFVVILLDNVGQEWLGCYGSEEGCTPHIDRLAREGLRFEACYAPPVCGPSRIVLLTGRYPFRTGFTVHHDAALYSGGGLDPTREVTFVRLLHDAGYATAIFGKWQINNLYDEPDALKRHGFDEHLVWPGSIDSDRASPDERRRFKAAVEAGSVERTAAMLHYIESRYWDPVFLRNGRRETNPGQFGPDLLQRAALDFLHRRRAEPFLLYFPMPLAHGQTFTEPAAPTPLNRDPNRPHQAMYADMVRYADLLIGRIVEELERLKLRDNTLVFVATDNGTESSLAARRNGRMVQGGLYQLTEAGGNVGLVVNSPRLVPGGRSAPLADFSDLLPTICDLAGVASPADRVIDGRSLADLIRGRPRASSPRQWIFNQYHTRRVVRDQRYKLYSTGQFYDLAADPEERHNLVETDPPAVSAARNRLADVLASLPPDTPPPFPLRSQSAFKLGAEGVR